MIDLDNLTRGQKAILNAFIVGGITFLSVLIAEPGLPTFEHIYAAFISSALTCLIRIQDFINKEPPESLMQENCKPKLKTGMLI